MHKFSYRAVTTQGQKVKGKLVAASLPQAREELTGQGLWVVDISNVQDNIFTRDIEIGKPRVKTEQFQVFCRQLATMYRAGISLVQAVQIISEQTESKVLMKTLLEVAEEMRGGSQFSDAARKYPHIFSPVFINMVHAGEAAGNLDTMLERLAIFYEKERNTREKVKSAMIYPIIMMVMMVAVVIMMMIFIIPQFASTFTNMGIELPLPTRIVMAASNFTIHYWYLVILFCCLPYAIWKYIRTSELGRRRTDHLKLKIPVFGKLSHKQAIARFARTFSTLMGAAVPVIQSLNIVTHVVGNEALGKILQDVKESVVAGHSMAEPMKASGLFPPMVVQMLAIGERSGAIDSMLDKVADFYEADVDQMSNRLKALLEPLMIVILTAIVGVIVLAVMMPSFSMMQNML